MPMPIPPDLRDAFALVDAIHPGNVGAFTTMTQQEATSYATALHRKYASMTTETRLAIVSADSVITVQHLLALRQFLIIRRAIQTDPHVAPHVIFHEGDQG
jgi:hypothetical protein